MEQVKNFKKIKVRWFLLWVIISFFVTAVFGVLNNFIYWVSPEIFMGVAGIFIYLAALTWLLISFNKYNINLKRLFFSYHKVKVSWGYFIFLTLLLTVLSLGIQLCIVYIFSFNPTFTNDLITNSKSPSNTIFSPYQFFTTLVLGPFVEELFFRGYLFNKWGETIGAKKSLLISSFIFGICHIAGGGFFAQFFLGLLCCIAYIKTKSLIVPIVLHMFANTTVTILYYLLPNDTGNEKMDPVTIANQLKLLGEIGLVFIVLILPVSLFLLIRLYKQSNKQPPNLSNIS
jgi:uncharacterized protein